MNKMGPVKWIMIGSVALVGVWWLFQRSASAAPIPEYPDGDPRDATPDWTDEDFVELEAIANRLGMNPADLLLVLTSESGLKPYAHNDSPSQNFAVGLNQITAGANLMDEATRLSMLGWTVAQQLPWVEKTFQKNPYSGPWSSAGVIYASNFLPGRLVARGGGSDVVLAENPEAYYTQNKGLDFNGDGKITNQDLSDHLREKIAPKQVYRAALRRLYEATGNAYAPTD